MNLLVSRKSWMLAPALALAAMAALALVWAVMEPEALRAAFDRDGRSFFEVLTLPFYALIVPAVWLCCPFSGSRKRKAFLCAAVSLVAVMAVVKETDLHLAALHALYPDVVGPDGGVTGLVKPNGEALAGTPFKMRFLTNGAAPLGAKALVLVYFASFFGVFAALLLYYARPLLASFFRLHPVAWSVACLGGSGVMVQVCDRLPSWWRHSEGLAKDAVPPAFASFCTAFEEGGEMMLAAFALLAILQAHAIYAPDSPDESLRI